MEQKHPADIYTEVLDHLWNGLGLEEKGWKRLKKGDFKKRTKNGLTYLIWFERSRYNYLDYEIGLGNVEVGFSCKRHTGQWTQEDEAGYQLYQQETDPKKRTFRVWYLIANPRGLPKEFVQKELEFRWKLFPEKKEQSSRPERCRTSTWGTMPREDAE